MAFLPSPQQSAFFAEITNGRGSVVLQAVAGAGKTTTLVEGLRLMTGYTSVIMFNKDAAADFKAKAAKAEIDMTNIRISTCHAAGLSAWSRFDPKSASNMQENKTRLIIEKMIEQGNLSREDMVLLDANIPYLAKVIDLGKQYLLGIKVKVSASAFRQLADRFGLDMELDDTVDVEALNNYAVDIFNTCAEACRSNSARDGMVDHSDMIWAPLYYKVKFFTNNNVVLDEAQDTNPLRRELCRALLKPGVGRLFAVGDSAQAIYAFTGANSDALDLIKRDFNAHEMPLTVSYRCPIKVVEFAQKWVSHIQAHPDAADGIVRQVKLDPQPRTSSDPKPRPWYMVETLCQDDFILCRYNRPLLQTAFGLIKNGIPCKMAGRDIGDGLVKLATKWKVKSLDALEGKIDAWRAKEVAKAKAKHSETLEQSANDRADCIKVFIERCRSKGMHDVSCVVAEIQALFSDKTEGYLTLSSIHKAKGRERHRVYWIQHKEPGRDMKDWEITSERNLKYVAATRAQSELVLVHDGTK